MRHRLALDEFAVQRRIGRTAAYGEIIGRRDHGPPVDIGAAKDEVARGNVDQRALFVVGTPPGNLANLAKTAVVDHTRQPHTRVHLAPALLARYLAFAAHLFGHRPPRGELVVVLFPAPGGTHHFRPRSHTPKLAPNKNAK